jgi:hypothetical protein
VLVAAAGISEGTKKKKKLKKGKLFLASLM